MASDLSRTPTSGLLAQISGDAHVANFGGYASPERRLVFDINDFDETVRGPWEWDVKRLATSVVLSGREREHRDRACDAAARAAVSSYRDRIAEYGAQPVVDVWYASIDISGAVRTALDGRARRTWLRVAESAQRHTDLALLPKITHVVGDRLQFVDDPPGLVRLDGDADMHVRAGRARRVSRDAASRRTAAARPFPARRRRAQGRRRRQRRHVVRAAAAARSVGRAAAAAGEGGARLGARAVRAAAGRRARTASASSTDSG